MVDRIMRGTLLNINEVENRTLSLLQEEIEQSSRSIVSSIDGKFDRLFCKIDSRMMF